MTASVARNAADICHASTHNLVSNPTSDPAVYDLHHQKFTSDGLPTSAEGWLERARQVSEILEENAVARDIENKSPLAEISLLKSAGLLKVLGPIEIGGGGQSWELGYKIIREVAKGDGSIGMLLGYHLLWSTTANVVGNDEQKTRVQKLIIENNYFVGGSNWALFKSYGDRAKKRQVPSILAIMT